MENLEAVRSNAEYTVILCILKAAMPVDAVKVLLNHQRNVMALPFPTRTTEEDSKRFDGLSGLHGNDSTLSLSSVEADYLLLFAIQSSHQCTIFIWW